MRQYPMVQLAAESTLFTQFPLKQDLHDVALATVSFARSPIK
jgi:hypothetical protein